MPTYTATTRVLTPLFNTGALKDELGKGTRTHLTLDNGHWRPLETLLPRRIPLIVEEIQEDHICKVNTPAYCNGASFFTDTRFLNLASLPLREWKRPPLPPLTVFLSRIDWCLKKNIPYLWGGNAPLGTHSLYELYPSQCPLHLLDEPFKKIWTLKGVDCSGLIYFATRGATARNTSDLIEEGAPVEIQGLSSKNLITSLKPGMLIVWKGHVLVVTKKGIVDSSPEKGVSLSSTQEKIEELIRLKVPINAWPSSGNPLNPSFVVRDLYPTAEHRGSD